MPFTYDSAVFFFFVVVVFFHLLCSSASIFYIICTTWQLRQIASLGLEPNVSERVCIHVTWKHQTCI